MVKAPVREGEVFEGKYLVEKVIGAGGMGVVVAAKHVTLDQRVAIKFLLPAAAADVEITARFMREARILAKIESPHVARVMDVASGPGGAPYIVMEYLDGQDLSRLLRERGRLPAAEVAAYVLQACDAISEAHAAGVIHRDLKPANLFLARSATSRGRARTLIKVLDFGISKSLDADNEGGLALTKTTALLGSPLYMAPEQLRATKDVDARADVWGLGAILFELVAGRPPFLGDTMATLVAAVMYEPLPLDLLPPEVDVSFRAVLSRALAKDRQERFTTVEELAAALAPLADPNLTSRDRTNPPEPLVSAMASTALATSPPLGTSPPVLVPVTSLLPPILPRAPSDAPAPAPLAPTGPPPQAPAPAAAGEAPLPEGAVTARDAAWGTTRSSQAKRGLLGQWIAPGVVVAALAFVWYARRDSPVPVPVPVPASPASFSASAPSEVAPAATAATLAVPSAEIVVDASVAVRPRPAAVAIPGAVRTVVDAGGTNRAASPPSAAAASTALTSSQTPPSIPRLPEFQPK